MNQLALVLHPTKIMLCKLLRIILFIESKFLANVDRVNARIVACFHAFYWGIPLMKLC